MNTAQRVRILALILIPALVAAAASVVGMLLTPDLPENLAVHWGADGTVNRVDGLGSYLGLVGFLVPGFVLVMVGFSISPLRRGTSRLFVRMIVGITAWFGVFLSGAMFLTVQAQRGVTDPYSLSSSTVVAPLLIGVAAGLVVAIVAALLAPKLPQSVGLSAHEASTPVADGELVYWARDVSSPRAIVALPIVIMLGVGVLFVVTGISLWITVLVELVLASLLTMMSWRVVVDQRGLTVTGLFGFPRFRIPLESIVAAAAIDTTVMRDFGGWGVRFGRSGWGVIARSGSAIEVQRRSGANFVVTVDDAETAAGLLTSLAKRVH